MQAEALLCSASACILDYILFYSGVPTKKRKDADIKY